MARVSAPASVRLYVFVGKSPSGQAHFHRDASGTPCAGYPRRHVTALPIRLDMAMANYAWVCLVWQFGGRELAKSVVCLGVVGWSGLVAAESRNLWVRV